MENWSPESKEALKKFEASLNRMTLEEKISLFNEITCAEDEIIIKCSPEKMAKAFFKDYEIIWHDPNVNSKENQQYFLQLKKVCKVKTFSEWKEAEDYIKNAKKVCHVITSGTNGELLVKEIFTSDNVPNIFTFCRNEEVHSAWMKNYEKVLCTETKIEDVISQIQMNLLKWQKQMSSLKFDLPAFAPIFDENDKSSMNYLHFYLKVIPNFNNRTQAKKDFLDLSKNLYRGQGRSEKAIAEFEDCYNQYDMETILKWYTKPSFLHKVINNCLRIATSDSIQYCRLVLKDIERAIKDQYRFNGKNFSGLLYRSAYLSEREWLSLKQNVNREIEMHGFLSVSKEDKIAWKFMSENPTQKVFITIIVPKGPNEEEQGFAEIEEFSEVSKEQEILFNVRSRFTVLKSEDEHSKDLPHRHLVLFYGAQSLRKFLAEKNPVQQILIEYAGDISCSACRVPINEVVEKMFFLSLVDLEKRIYSCKRCLEDTAAPFLCIPATGKVSKVNLKGCLLLNSSQSQFPLYGYRCLQCGIKKQRAYFVCTDCSESKKTWCESCFGKKPDCVEAEHSVILETSPFSFWCEKMSEKELNHLNFQKDEIKNSNHIFQQGAMYFKTHEYTKAVKFLRIYIEQNEGNRKDLMLASCFNNLGYVYAQQGEYKMALENYFKSLDIRESVNGGDRVDLAILYQDIGSAYNNQGEYKKALEYFLKSADINQSIYGKDHLSSACSFNNIGSLYYNQGEYKKALECHFISLDISKSLFGENDPLIANCYSNIGLAYSSQGEYDLALEYHLKCLDITRSIHGENHHGVATAYDNLGGIYLKQGKNKVALEYFLKCLNICKSLYGENHPKIANVYNNIGMGYDKQGEEKKALEYFF